MAVPSAFARGRARAAGRRRRARGLALALALALGLGVAFAPSKARADELPAGKLGLGMGGRLGVGTLGSAFGTGGLLTVQAGYQPTNRERALSFGVTWSFTSSWFGFDDAASLAGSLRLSELALGARVRRKLGGRHDRFAFVGAGVILLRSNVPIPPDDDRNYVGPYAAVGAEGWAASYLFGVEFRYGLLAGGPGSLSVILSVSVGA